MSANHSRSCSAATPVRLNCDDAAALVDAVHYHAAGSSKNLSNQTRSICRAAKDATGPSAHCADSLLVC